MLRTNMKTDPNKIARIAGILYLLLIPLGIFGILYVPEFIIGGEDIAAKINNILANEALFRLSIVSALAVQLVNLFVALYLYKLLEPVNKGIAKLMVIFIGLAIPIAMFNEINHGAVLLLIHSADYSPSLVSLFLDLHNYGVFIAQIFWGLWLFPMGWLIYKSTYLPKVIGILLMIGCFGYFIDSFIFFMNPDFAITFSEFLFVGEVALPLWLLFKGVNVERWQKVSRVSAS